jgi:hypothetical protein
VRNWKVEKVAIWGKLNQSLRQQLCKKKLHRRIGIARPGGNLIAPGIKLSNLFPHQNSDSLVKECLGDIAPEASVELATYLSDGFGNSTRIDYGTGHEMAFVIFLCALFKVGAWKDEDRAAVGLKIFQR